jgi:ABC-2 type transport system permease protein
VGTAAQLRLALLRGSLRSGPGAAARRAGVILGAVSGAIMGVAALAGLSVARGHGRLPEDLSVVLFCALLVGWVVLPVLTFGSDDLLDPSRLALLPLTRRQLLTVMGVGSLIGVAPIATVVAALGLLPATGRDPVSYLVALLSVVLLLALCVSASRATAAALSGLLRSRRGRDLGVVLAALVGLSFQLLNPLLQVAASHGHAGQDAFHGLAGPLRWTPPGLLAAAPGRSLPGAVGSLLVAAAVVGLLLVVWERSVRRSLERAEITSSRRRRGTALAPRGVPVPAGRVGAIMAKDLRYLVREPRRLVATVTAVLLPLAVALGPLVLNGGRPSRGLVFVVCGVGLFSAVSGGNRFGLDGSATWLLLSSAVDQRDARRDLQGGDLAIAAVTFPALLLVAGLLAAVTGGWIYLPPALGIAFALLGIGVAVSGLIAVTAPYAVPPSQNAFGSGGAGQGCTAGVLVIASILAEIAVCLPLLGLLLPALLVPSPALGFALLVVGPAYGLAVGALLRRKAARRWAERAPEVLQVLAAGRG